MNLNSIYPFLFLSLVLVTRSVGQNPETSGPAFQLEPQAVANLKLQFASVEKAAVGIALEATGTVRLDETRVYDVTPKIEGVIVDDRTALGDRVSKGDVLFQLQSATLSEMISAYVSAEEAMTYAVAAAAQEKRLAERNLASKEQLRKRELELSQAVAGHSRALQPLKLLNFDEGTIHQYLSLAKDDYSTLEVVATGGGEIVEKHLRIGAAVQHDEHLFTVADLSELWVDFQVALRDVEGLNTGDTVRVNSTVTEKMRDASIIYISPVADEQSRTVMVRALMKNDDSAWRPGNPVSVAASGSAVGKSLVVPSGAVVDFEGGKAVFVQGSEGQFSTVPVEVGRSDGKKVSIKSGLKGGETVVSKNAAQLKGHLEMTAE